MIVRTPALLTTTSLGRSLVLASLTVLLAACGSAVKLDETPVESRTGSAIGGAGAAGAGAAAAGAGQGANASGAGAGQQVTTVDTPHRPPRTWPSCRPVSAASFTSTSTA